MYIQAGINSIIDFYNFIISRLVKEDLYLRVNNSDLEFTQDGTWTCLPEPLHEVFYIPRGFKKGKVRKNDLIALHESLAFIAGKQGRVADCYMNSYISPEKFGFSVWSRYPDTGFPGVKKVGTFRLKVRNRFGIPI